MDKSDSIKAHLDSARETGLVADATNGRHIELTPSSKVQIDYIAVPPALSDYVMTFYNMRCDEEVIRDVQPAAVGHLTIFPYGTGEMYFRDGRVAPSHETNLLTPFSVAAPFQVDGPFHSVGAALSPLGWASLTHMHAGEYGNRLERAGQWLGDGIDELGAGLCRDYRDGTKDAQACAKVLGEYIEAHLEPIKPEHAALIRMTTRWLAASFNPDTADLMEQAPYSQRQVQRLVEQYFGLPPRALARKYRALRAAALLSLPSLAPEFEAQVGEAFYDQPHMIREIRMFAGRTPSRLVDEEKPYLTEMLDLRNFREIELPPADSGE